MKEHMLTGAVLPPSEDHRTWVPSRHRRAYKAWQAWKKWNAFESVPVLGAILFVQVFIGTAFLRIFEGTLANNLYEVLSPFTLGDWWWIGILLCCAVAFVLAVIWKKMIVRFFYHRCTTKYRRRLGLEPEREPLIVEL